LKAIAADLIEARKRAKVPDSLQQLAIGCVFQNLHRFLLPVTIFSANPDTSPFANIREYIIK